MYFTAHNILWIASTNIQFPSEMQGLPTHPVFRKRVHTIVVIKMKKITCEVLLLCENNFDVYFYLRIIQYDSSGFFFLSFQKQTFNLHLRKWVNQPLLMVSFIFCTGFLTKVMLFHLVISD